jgi:Protein of unknown function (DUF1173)
VTRLESVIAQGRFGDRRLSDLLYVVPAFRVEDQQQINAKLESMMRSHRATAISVPSFLIIGEVTHVTMVGKALMVKLRHQARPLWTFPSFGDRLATRYPIAEAILTSGNAEGRVVGLFMVEVTSEDGLWIKDGALMTCSREYIPCDSSYEVRLANLLTQSRRSFLKPLKIEHGMDLLPDFKLLDCAVPTVMEVWGMNTPEYLAHRQAKIQRYSQLGLRLWEWDAVRYARPPALPPATDL